MSLYASPTSSDAAFPARPDEFHRLVPSRFGLGAHHRPQLWDAMMRSLASAEPPPASRRGVQEQPEEEDDNHDSQALVKRPKTNSERGRAFRARKKQHEDALLAVVSALRQEVADLGFLRSVRADKILHSRNSMGGSLVRLARQYFALFERGMPSVLGVGHKRPALTDGSEQFESKQQEFLHCAMDPDMQFGEAVGPEALLDQWKRYTRFHESMTVEVVGVEVSGEEDNPLVTVRSDLHVVFSRATFDNVFPHVADNEELVRKFVGREVVYHGVNRFQFSPKGQIVVYDSDVGFVDALVEAGASVDDIALLMQQARIADESRIGEEGSNNRVQELESDSQEASDDYSEAATDSDVSASTPPCAGSDTEEASSSNRLAIDFLLS